MRTVTYKLADLSRAVLHLGKMAENDATQVRIDAAEVFNDYPNAVPALDVINPTGEAYTVEVTRDGNFVVWDVKDSSLTAEGQGEIQLTFTQDGTKVKSSIGRTQICRSITGGGTPPDPVQDWLDHANEVLAEVEDAIPEGGTTGQVLAKKSDEDYDLEWIDQDAGGVSDYDDLENRPQIGGVTLTGDKSLHDLGAAAESDIPDVSGFYTKPAGGIPASDIAAGVIPDPAALIDDTSTAANKVWSASKTNELKSAITKLTPDATASDIGKAIIVKTVANGKPTSYEYGEAGGSGTSDYDELTDKPQINGVTLSGNKSTSELGLLSGETVANAVDDWLEENITNPDSPPLDRSLLSSSSAAPADIVGDIKNVVDDISGEIKTFDDFGTVERGNNSSSGSYDSSVKYRVATPNIITIPRKYTADIADGFRLYVIVFVNGVKSSAGWVSNNYIFQSGSTVKINIARVTENTSEIADVDTFCSKVQLNPDDGFGILKKRVETIENGEGDIGGAEFNIDSLGTFSRGGISSASGSYDSYYTWRIATQNIVTVPKDYVVHISEGYRLYVAYFTSNTFTKGEWVSDGAVLPKNSKVRLCVAKVTEDTSQQADIPTFSSKVKIRFIIGNGQLRYDIDRLTYRENLLDAHTYGIVWDWWITAQSVDQFGNAYIGYIDTDGYQGVLRRQPDGVIQYKRLCKSENNDDHNGLATKVLSDGRILVIGTYGHSENNHIQCFRSKNPYSIDSMEDLSFDIPVTSGWEAHCTYSQVFAYDGTLYDFLRMNLYDQNQDSVSGYVCLVSADNGTTWTPYKVAHGSDPYLAMAQATDNEKYIKFIKANAPPTGTSTHLFGGYIDLSDMSIYNLSGTKLGEFAEWGGSLADDTISLNESETGLTQVTQQSVDGKQGRMLFTARTQLSDTVFLYAQAVSSSNNDYIYRLYNNGTVTDIAHSGRPFGNVSYISGACFGYAPNIVYYSKCIGNKSDGPHEIHRVVVGESLEDTLIATSGICMIRPIYIDNGMIAVANGYYNDTNGDGSGTNNYTRWKLNPMFLQG